MTVLFTFYLLTVVSSLGFSYEIPQQGLSATCKSNDDCHQIKNSHCNDEKLSCECRSGYTVDGSLTRCLKIANGYYDTCEESVQCSGFLGVGGMCEDNQRCVCTENYHYLHGRCIRSKGLDETCSNNDECSVNAEHQAATCKNGKCKCSEDFYQREYSTCRAKAKNIDDDCMLDSDCTYLHEKATCVSNKCALNKERISAINRSISEKEETLPKISNIVIGESKCEDDGDCKSLDHSICAANNTCVCDRTYFPLRIKSREGDFIDGCVPELGQPCNPEESKSVFSIRYSICKNNVWTCITDKVALKNNQICRKYAINIEASCSSPESCYLFGPRAECADRKCKCNEKSYWLNKEKFCWKYSKIQENCKNDNDCYSRNEDYNPTCNSGICNCPKGSISSDDYGYCYSSEPVLGSYCEKNEECKSIPNTSCENMKCDCAETFFQLDGQCVKGLNAICENDDECKLENTACLTINEEKICKCTENFVDGSENVCLKKSYLKENCTEDVQCTTAVKNTFCNMTTRSKVNYEHNNDDEDVRGHCNCIDNYYFNIDACYRKRKLGQTCKKERECYTKSSTGVCKNSICTCDIDFIRVKDDCKLKNASTGLFFSSWLLLAIVTIVSTIP